MARCDQEGSTQVAGVGAETLGGRAQWVFGGKSHARTQMPQEGQT